MLSPLTPSTPPGIPVVPASTEHDLIGPEVTTSLVRQVAGAVVEEQDPAGKVAVAFFAMSSISSAIVWAVAVGVIPMTYYHITAPFSRLVGMPLFIVSMGFGFLSERRLPRWLALYFTTIAVCWYGWDRFGLPGSIYPWNVATHAILGLVAAVPSLVAQAWRRLRKGTA
jgi:hypothetical protein